MKSTEEMEQPAKRWEVGALSEQVKAQSELIKAVSTKLDVLIAQPHLTKEQVEELIKIQVDKVYAKYDPVYSAAKWFAGVLIVAVVGQVVYLGFQLFGGKP